MSKNVRDSGHQELTSKTALLDGRRREAEDKTFQDATISKWDKRMTKPTVRRHLEQAMAVVSKDFVTLCFKAYMENVYVLRQL